MSAVCESFPYFEVNAFTSKPFGGNPAGVAVLPAWPEDVLMQKIAKDNMFSDTAFLISTSLGSYHLRWFTPAMEVKLCGHATLASGHIILNLMQPALPKVVFHSRSGDLSVVRSNHGGLTMDFPWHESRRIEATKALETLFDRKPVEIYDCPEGLGNFLLVFEGGEAAILGLKPNLAAMAKFPRRAFIATARGGTCDFVSRYFAPNYGISEDPVTGSSHSALAPYWGKVLKKSRMAARQLSARGGELGVELKAGRVEITGECFLVKEGAYYLANKPGKGGHECGL